MKGESRVEMPPKLGIHTQPDAFIHTMPAYIPDMNAAGMKWVAGYPDNHSKGLPYISGLMILNDPMTGLPLAVMDCVWVTAKRTGAATALAAKYLARAESETIGILRCGVQGESNLEALMIVQNQIKLAQQYANEISALAWELREGFEIEMIPPEQAVSKLSIMSAAEHLRTEHIYFPY